MEEKPETPPGLAIDVIDDSLIALAVPFSRATALERGQLSFPAAVHAPNGRSLRTIRPSATPLSYMQLELDVSRLNSIHHHLWLAGLPRPARSLHRQELIGRKIVITEQADLHLVWFKSRIFIKPLPAFLLHYDCWEELAYHPSSHQEACGLLYSYTWLISRNSDLKRAVEIGLLPDHITWERWTAFASDFLQHVDIRWPEIVNQRYHYGELRLPRLNTIFRMRGLRQGRFRSFRSGYFQEPDWYTRFLQENFGWLVVVFGYIALVLNAMQVGLGTARLSGNDLYQDTAYGFSTFAIAMPVIIMGLVIVTSTAITIWNVQGTLRYVRNVERARGSKSWEESSG